MNEDLIGNLEEKFDRRFGMIAAMFLLMLVLAVCAVFALGFREGRMAEKRDRIAAEVKTTGGYYSVSREEFDREWKRFGGPWVFTDTTTGHVTPAEPIDVTKDDR